MKRFYFLFLIALISTYSFAQQKIKVACIGNSITAGSGVKDKNNVYPAQLQRMLGDGYEVVNFGVSGRTMLKNGDRPYWKEKAFVTAKEFAPDIVIIKLGTNDSKAQNWKFASEFESDYRAFIQEFKNLPSKPKIWLCYPVPVVKTNFGITDSVVRTQVIPHIKNVAKAEDLKIINLYKGLKNFKDHIPDGVHPDDVGAGQIAKTVYKAIRKYKVNK
jgi:lysophospholipase L1-like esterase